VNFADRVNFEGLVEKLWMRNAVYVVSVFFRTAASLEKDMDDPTPSHIHLSLLALESEKSSENSVTPYAGHRTLMQHNTDSARKKRLIVRVLC
jgi:hypothetical protein